MADQNIAFGARPVPGGEQTAFTEGVLNNTETTIELDMGGDVRLSAVAFEAGFAGASITVSAVVPWASGDANSEIVGFTISVEAGKVVKVPFDDAFWAPKLLLTVNAAQTATKKIGFFGWRGKSQ
jgi:hypothetical protein